LAELLRFATTETAGLSGWQPGVLVSEMIRQRVSRLSSTARKLLEVLSVSGEPVSRPMLYDAVQGNGGDPATETTLLVREYLVRFAAGPQGEYVEPFHDQVREAALTWLSPQELRDWHSRLAALLEDEAELDQRRLLRHYRGAGNSAAALKAAIAAAESSQTTLAFEQAAQFYAEALETGQADEQTQASLYRKRAEVLVQAGRGYEAAQCYLEAARWPAYNDATEAQRLAAEHSIRSGHLDEGTGLLIDLLRSAGFYIPSNRLQTLFWMLAIRVFIRMRGLNWSERPEADVPNATLRKLDLLWAGAMALVTIDTISGTYLHALHMLAALRTGEPARLCLSLAFAAIYDCLGGTREYNRGRKLINLSQQLAQRVDDSYLMAMTYGCWTGLDFLSGRVQDGLSHCRTALAAIGNRRRRAWETGTFHFGLIWFLGWGGRIRELAETLPILLEEGRSRGDVYTEVSLRCSGVSHLVNLAADDCDGALAEITRSIQQWRKTSYDLPHFYATFATVECLFYAGRDEEARQLLLSDWQAIGRSLFTRKSQIHRTLLFYLRGRTALSEWLRHAAPDLRTETEQFARKLRKLQSPWADAFSDMLRAGVLAGLQHQTDSRLLLKRAEDVLRAQELRLVAAAVQRRRGELEGDGGEDQIRAGDAFMRSENVHRPERITAVFLPGNWRFKASDRGVTAGSAHRTGRR
jgi:hypothetical protein